MSQATRRQVADCQASVTTATETPRRRLCPCHQFVGFGPRPARRGRGARLARQRR